MLVVPVYNMVLAPDSTVFFPLSLLQRSAGDRNIAVQEKVILIVARENENFTDMNETSFYPIGVAGIITELNQQGFAVIKTQYRVDVEAVSIDPDHTLKLTISRRNDLDDLDSVVEAEKLKNLLQEMRAFSAGFQWAESAEFYLNQIDSIGMAACVLSPWLKISNEERYAILCPADNGYNSYCRRCLRLPA